MGPRAGDLTCLGISSCTSRGCCESRWDAAGAWGVGSRGQGLWCFQLLHTAARVVGKFSCRRNPGTGRVSHCLSPASHFTPKPVALVTHRCP